jgi:hypothetical protein
VNREGEASSDVNVRGRQFTVGLMNDRVDAVRFGRSVSRTTAICRSQVRSTGQSRGFAVAKIIA